jgi:hypothetical protein
VFVNRVLRRISGPKREEEVVESWITSHNGEFHNVYASSNIIRVIKTRKIGWGGGHVLCMGKMRNTYNILVKSEGK